MGFFMKHIRCPARLRRANSEGKEGASMNRDLSEYIIANFKKALDRGHIRPYYQPVIRTVSRRLCSFEALARWIDPAKGMIYPDEFVPVLERERLIHLLDLCVIRQACAQVRMAMDSGSVPVPVSVNLSRLDFVLCDIFTEVDAIVSEYHLPHDFVYIEITESVMAEQKDVLLDVVARFRDAGYQIWMDDFGSAYSSLNLLKEYSFNELKLDMCFLRPFNRRSQHIMTSVIDMAKGLDIHTLAEGVETEEQFLYLRNIGCEKVQGSLFGEPAPYLEGIARLHERGVDVEPPQERKYYDEVGMVNVLSAVPFMTKDERDAITSALQLNSIALALLELREDAFSVLFYNTEFERVAQGTGMFSLTFGQDILRQPLSCGLLSDKLRNLMDATRGGEDGRMFFTSHEDYYEIQARCVSRTGDRYCVLLRMSNLSKAAHAEMTNRLDEYLRQIYAVYDRITLVDLNTDTITPLYVSTRETLVSSNRDAHAMAREFARRYIFPEDRSAYLRLVDPDTVRERIDAGGHTFLRAILRTATHHGQYAWKCYTLLRMDADRFLILVSDVHESAKAVRAVGAPEEAALLWRNLNESELLRVFWKDTDRRFLGASRAFLDYYGFSSRDEIIGKTDEDLGWHIHPDAYMTDEVRVIHEGVTTHNIPGWCLNDGENKEILASKAPLYNENGEISGLIGYFIDRDLLSANDVRGRETKCRDLLTGLLNSRGIWEEAGAFRDEYYLRGVDFARIHIAIDDFTSINEQYGFDYGDRVMSALGGALKKSFGRTCAVGRYAGQRFVVLHQVQSVEEAGALRAQIKSIGASVRQVDGIPVTLYLSVGYVLFSEFPDLDEQAKKAEMRLLADHDNSVPTESLVAKSSHIFHLFDELPVIYAVYHVTADEEGNADDAVLFYVNRKYEELDGRRAPELLGRSIRQLYPSVPESWYADVARAALTGETARGELPSPVTGVPCGYTATQIIACGYSAVTYL